MPTKKVTVKKPAPVMVEFEVSATIPTAQYANVQPVVKGYGATFELARDDALIKMKSIWDMVGEGGKTLELRGVKVAEASNVVRERLKCFASGTELNYDDAGHTYLDDNGDKYTSGSTYARQFAHEFDTKMIAPLSANKLGISTEDVIAFWKSKGTTAMTFGTALHQALEHYGKYKDLADMDMDSKTGQHKGYGINATLLPIVEAFFKDRLNEVAVYEPFVADPTRKWCGRIDRLLIVDKEKKICRVQDYKTNGDLYKQGKPVTLKPPYAFLPNTPLGEYTLQLNFYREILVSAGWTVEGLDIFHWTGAEWKDVAVREVALDE